MINGGSLGEDVVQSLTCDPFIGFSVRHICIQVKGQTVSLNCIIMTVDSQILFFTVFLNLYKYMDNKSLCPIFI